MAKSNNNHTELIWSGKFTEEVKLPTKRIADNTSLPFQTIELINEPREEVSQGLPFPTQQKEGWRNKLIWGDNKLVIASLLKDFAGKVDLIYIDPPYDVGADFSIKVKVGDESVTKAPSLLEEKAYRDTWGKGTDSYLQMMYDRLLIMRELLSEEGSIYVHLDWHVGHYVKLILDEIFGRDNFRNEIIWCYKTPGRADKFFKRKHDNVYFYSKSSNNIFNGARVALSDSTIRVWGKHFDKDGLITYGYLREKLPGFYKSLMIKGERPDDSVFLDLNEGAKANDWWDDLPMLNKQAEFTGFGTQKTEALLERVIQASSNPGSLVVDVFCGSGTTGAVAEKLGRRWIMCDLGRFAIHTSRKRLMGVQRKLKDEMKEFYPFEILNLGKYERQQWQATLGNGSQDKDTQYIQFIIQLYKAEALNGFLHIHGKKDNQVVHVGAVDAPVTMSEVAEVLAECEANNLTKLNILGWEWEMSVNEEAVKLAQSQGVDLKLWQIPKEVMEKQAVEKGDVKFFELDHMAVEVEKKGKQVKVKLTGFAIPSEDLIPDDLREKITNWTDYVDYWSVDWDYQSLVGEDNYAVFENNWQTFRSKQQPKLELETPWHEYEASKTYSIAVKTIDIFGNDTSKVLEVKI